MPKGVEHRSVISSHLWNISHTDELAREAVAAKNATTGSGKKMIFQKGNKKFCRFILTCGRHFYSGHSEKRYMPYEWPII